MTYSIGAMYRYYPTETSHYTAVIQPTTVLQVKPFVHTPFDTLEAWCASLPNTPTVEQLVYTPPKSSHGVQIHAKEGWNVPNGNTTIAAFYWPIHIYRMISEANPEQLMRDDIRDAYNQLMSVLDIHQHVITTAKKYLYGGIDLHPSAGLPYRTVFKKGYDRYGYQSVGFVGSDTYEAIAKAYRPLYQLIKGDVLPYMKRKYEEYQLTMQLKEKERAVARFQKKIYKLQRSVADAQSQIASLKKQLE